jgi:hypothetical protein
MHRTLLRSVIFLTILYSSAYAFARIAAVYFYVTEFQDFVKQEVKFAPVRNNTDETRLFEHIRDAARFYNLEIDPANDIKIQKTVTIPGMHLTTLGVDVKYTALVDLNVIKRPLHFHTAASATY